MRFDKLEFTVLNAQLTGCYIPTGEAKERALLLMEEGIFENNPYEKWHLTGWKLTKKGKEYTDNFLKTLREKHGHTWKTHHDTDPDLYTEDDSYGKELDSFAYYEGYHNGYVCKTCGYTFCHHCLSEFDVPSCSG